MFVQALLPIARERLVTIDAATLLFEAAGLLRSGTDLVVVCGAEEGLAGVITKTDVVRQVEACQGACFAVLASAVMTRHVILCQPSDWLPDVWAKMRDRGLKNVPIADDKGRPIGVLNARDALETLLREAEDEETLLREYVTGVGYH